MPEPPSPQYVKAHPLDLGTLDSLLTLLVTSNIQRLQLPQHEMTYIQMHAHTHTRLKDIHVHARRDGKKWQMGP